MMIRSKYIFIIICFIITFSAGIFANNIHSYLSTRIGTVDTAFKMFGPNHKIIIEVFNDPDIKNVSCYISRAKTGGIIGGLGLAEDTTDVAIACEQRGPIELDSNIIKEKSQGKIIFHERLSLLFKKLQVARFFDKERNTLIYLTFSGKILNGSPKNAISIVPIISWKQ